MTKTINFNNIPISEILFYSIKNKLSSLEFKNILKNNNRLIPVYYDIMFKYFLSSISSRNVLIDILSFATDMDSNIIRDNLSIVDPLNISESYFDKSNTSDLKCEINNNLIILEMNLNPSKILHDKNASGLFREFNKNFKKGMDYDETEFYRNYLINFDFRNIVKSNEIKLYCTMRDKNTNIEVLEDVIFIHILLENIYKKYYTKNGMIKSDINLDDVPIIDKLFMILNISYVSDLEKLFKSKGMDKYMSSKYDIERLNEAEKIIDEYYRENDKEIVHNLEKKLLEKQKKELKDKNNELEDKLKNKDIEIVKNMLNKKIDINLISELTNLTIDEINEIKEEI